MSWWRDVRVIVLARIVLRLAADLIGLAALTIRPWRSAKAENLLLRRQLALYKERGVTLRSLPIL